MDGKVVLIGSYECPSPCAGRAEPLIYLRKMARPEGLEPPTTWFEARYSIQLSYGRSNLPIDYTVLDFITSSTIRPTLRCTVNFSENSQEFSIMVISKRFFRTLLLPASLLMSFAANADLSAVPSGEYQVDPTHAYINFQYTHLGLSKPTLSFDDFDIMLQLDADPGKSAINVNIEAASIITGSKIWTENISGDDFFAIANNPSITFASTAIEATGEDTYTVTGDLTIKRITKPITLDVTINGAIIHPLSGKPTIGFSANGQLLRSDFGMGKFAPGVSDEVDLTITAEMIKS